MDGSLWDACIAPTWRLGSLVSTCSVEMGLGSGACLATGAGPSSALVQLAEGFMLVPVLGS